MGQHRFRFSRLIAVTLIQKTPEADNAIWSIVHWRPTPADSGRFGKQTFNARHQGLGARWANIQDLLVLRPVELVHNTVHYRREGESHCDKEYQACI